MLLLSASFILRAPTEKKPTVVIPSLQFKKNFQLSNTKVILIRSLHKQFFLEKPKKNILKHFLLLIPTKFREIEYLFFICSFDQNHEINQINLTWFGKLSKKKYFGLFAN